MFPDWSLFQRLNFSIWIIEQTGSDPFNRAQLLNIGVNEILKSEVKKNRKLFPDEGDRIRKAIETIETLYSFMHGQILACRAHYIEVEKTLCGPPL